MKDLSIEELKDFILWAKDQKIQQVSIGNTTVVFSNLAFLDENNSFSVNKSTNTEGIASEVTEKHPNQTEDPDLFYST